MALPKCRRCGKQDPQRMHGLMSLWFAPLIDLEADLGYFYLCPACHDEIIVPELERIQNRILELHPAAQRSLEEEWDEPPAEDESEPGHPSPGGGGADAPEEETDRADDGDGGSEVGEEGPDDAGPSDAD